MSEIRVKVADYAVAQGEVVDDEGLLERYLGGEEVDLVGDVLPTALVDGGGPQGVEDQGRLSPLGLDGVALGHEPVVRDDRGEDGLFGFRHHADRPGSSVANAEGAGRLESIKGVERVTPLLEFDLRGVEVKLTANRQDSPPKLVSVDYEIIVATDESDLKRLTEWAAQIHAAPSP